MTRRNRRAHLFIWMVIGPLMLATLAVAITMRPARAEASGEGRARGVLR